MPPTSVSAAPEELARELHDIVGHALSVIAVQAGTARAQLRRDPVAADAALDEVAAAAARAVEELRDLLLGLRGDADLPAVVAESVTAGDRVDADVQGVLAPQTAAVLAGIIREALTNARRHAPGARVELAVRVRGAAVHLRVANPAVEVGDAPGLGVRGMHERARAAGGVLRAGPDGCGRWVVDAVLPA